MLSRNSGQIMERNPLGTIGRNFRRNSEPEYNERKPSTYMQLVRKNPPPDSEQQRKQSNIKPSHQGTTNTKAVENHILPFTDGRPRRRLNKLQRLVVSPVRDQ